MPQAAIDLDYALKLPPKQAMAYLHDKGMYLGWDWTDLWKDANVKAFTVAKVAKADILQDIRSQVEKVLASGDTFETFKKNLTPTLQAKGWWGKKVVKLPAELGGRETVQLGSPWRLETIYRTNLQTAYMAGRYKQQWADRFIEPFWQFVSVLDSKTRPAHAALNGKVFKATDPFWETHYPPLGFNCRCRVRGLSKADMDEQGLTLDTAQGNTVIKNVVTQGKPHPMAGWRDPKTNIVHFPDPGFDYNPAKSSWIPDLGGYDPDIADKLIRNTPKAATAAAQGKATKDAQKSLADTLEAIKGAKIQAQKAAQEAMAKVIKEAEAKALAEWQAHLDDTKSMLDSYSKNILAAKTPGKKLEWYKVKEDWAIQQADLYKVPLENANLNWQSALTAWNDAAMDSPYLADLKQALDKAKELALAAHSRYAPFKIMADKVTADLAKYEKVAAKNAEKLAAKKVAKAAPEPKIPFIDEIADVVQDETDTIDDIMENLDDYVAEAKLGVLNSLKKLPSNEWNKLVTTELKAGALQAQVNNANVIYKTLQEQIEMIGGIDEIPAGPTKNFLKQALKDMKAQIDAIQAKADPLLAKVAQNAASKAAAAKAQQEAAEAAAKAAKEAEEKAALEALWKSPPKLEDMKQIGPQKGSNPGGQYQDSLGRKFYVKYYADANQARTEYAAGRVGKLLGIEAPESWLIDAGNKKLAFITRWDDDVKALTAKQMAEHADIGKAYHTAVITKDWDVVGLEYDNLMLAKNGKLTVIDSGGSFKFRAQGAAKPFGKDIDDYESLLDPSRPAGKVFQAAFTKDPTLEAKSARVLLNLDKKQVAAIMKDSGFSAKEAKDLTDTIMYRRDLALAKYKIDPKNAIERIGRDLEFTSPQAQRTYDAYFDQYDGLGRAEIKAEISSKCPNVYEALRSWQGATTHTRPMAFKKRVQLLETPDTPLIFKSYGITADDVNAALPDVPEDEYLRFRALNQAYMKAKKQPTVTLYRGIGGNSGEGFMTDCEKYRHDYPSNFKEQATRITENPCTGWTTKYDVAHAFGRIILHRTDIPARDVIVHKDLFTGVTHGYSGEAEFIVVSGHRDYSLANIEWAHSKWTNPVKKYDYMEMSLDLLKPPGVIGVFNPEADEGNMNWMYTAALLASGDPRQIAEANRLLNTPTEAEWIPENMP